MKATCVLDGAGIRPRTHLSNVEHIDITPTIAQLLGTDYSAVDGRPLAAALLPPPH